MLKRVLPLFAALLLTACGDQAPAQPTAAAEPPSTPPETTPAETPATAPATGKQAPPAKSGPGLPTLEEIQQDVGIPALAAPWTGDLDGMEERRVIRVLTVYGLGRYFLDGAQEKGITYELFRMFEDYINKTLGKKHLRVYVVMIPVARDELIPGLLQGRGDIAAAGLTITPERAQQVDFSNPVSREISEILVTGPSAPPLTGIEDLSGRDVYVRASSSYRSSLDELNRRLRAEGREGVRIVDVSEHLEDEDLLEMVSSGTLEWAVVDSYKADIWSGVFEDLTVRDDIVFRQGGRIGYAFRKNSPMLKAALNGFLKSHRQGTLKGNVLINRYLKNFDWAKNALASKDMDRFHRVVDIFRKYGKQYGFDYLIVTAQGYQESRLDQSRRSGAGAVGIMQLLPSTAADPNVGIPDISDPDANIHAGVRYLRFIRDRYFNEPGVDDFNRTLFALAAYNAGPARVRKWRNQAAQQDYDPDKWFDNVEVMAARDVGRETVQYVSNILKYYTAYRISAIREAQRASERVRGVAR